MLLEASAKINWSLDITGVREDGYHLMDMVMQPVSLADTIWLALPESAATLSGSAQRAPKPLSSLQLGKLKLSVSGYPVVRACEHHLAMRAALALQQATGCTLGADIHVRKRIPVGAGMGGGSADAAGVLYGLNLLWKTGLSQSELEALGLSLGADVPFCLRGGLCRTTGIGEKLADAGTHKDYWLIVIQPCRGLSTGAVFQAFGEADPPEHPNTEGVIQALKTGDFALLRQSMGNVLQVVSIAQRPEIGHAIQALREYGASAACMTGSGSAVFGVFAQATLARKAKEALRLRWHSTFMCHTQQQSIRILQG